MGGLVDTNYFNEYRAVLDALMAVSKALEDKQRECELLRLRIDALLAAREGADDDAND